MKVDTSNTQNASMAIAYDIKSWSNAVKTTVIRKNRNAVQVGGHTKYWWRQRMKRVSGTTTATETGSPIIYAVTVPKNARSPDLGLEFVKILVSKTGQDILAADGQEPIVPALGYGNVPAALKASGVVMA